MERELIEKIDVIVAEARQLLKGSQFDIRKIRLNLGRKSLEALVIYDLSEDQETNGRVALVKLAQIGHETLRLMSERYTKEHENVDMELGLRLLYT